MRRTALVLFDSPAVGRLAVAACLLMVAGCQSVPYKAATLPRELQAARVAGSSQLHLPNLAANASKSMAISPGDVLDVHIVSGVEQSAPEPLVTQVSEQGAVDLPLIGLVTIAGLERSVASQAITRAAIERGIYRQPSITVEVRERATYQVTVLGAVEKPGVHEIPVGSCNVLTAIAQAGGLTEDASAAVEVLRQSPAKRLANNATAPKASLDGDSSVLQQASYDAPPASPASPDFQRIDLAMTTRVAEGGQSLGDRDVVRVLPKEGRLIHVTGLVHKPDQFELADDQDVRVLDALAMAGGRSSPIADKVFVVRQRPGGGEPAMIEVSVAEAKKNGAENLILAAGDLVSVESTAATTTVSIVERFFRVSLGLTSAAFSL